MPPQPPSAADLELAAQFCPVVIFDSKEEIRPMRMQDYVAQSSIHDLKTDTVLQHNTHPAIDAQLATRSDVYLHLNHADWRRMDAEDVNDVPFYVKIDRDVMHQGQVCVLMGYPHIPTHHLAPYRTRLFNTELHQHCLYVFLPTRLWGIGDARQAIWRTCCRLGTCAHINHCHSTTHHCTDALCSTWVFRGALGGPIELELL